MNSTYLPNSTDNYNIMNCRIFKGKSFIFVKEAIVDEKELLACS